MRKSRTETIREVQRLAERIRLAGYGERTYEHTMASLSAQWRASGLEAEAQLVKMVLELFSREN